MKEAASQDRQGGFDPGGVRRSFAILGRELAWLDNAATTQRPEAVLRAMDEFYRKHNANPRRSVHQLGTEATLAFEGARSKVAAFLGASAPEEVVFTAGTTAGINLVANGLARWEIGPGDDVWVSAAEHHSNWVPWQQVARRMGATLKVIPLKADGRLDLEAFRKGLEAHRTKWVAVTWVSNVLGTENDVRAVCAAAHAAEARVLVDGAQGVAHLPMDVQDMGCDFLAFSGHKMYGPMGIGALWGRRELLEQMEPMIYGGEMISRVEDGDSTWTDVPWRFEGGTPHAAGAVGLAAAVDWLRELPSAAHEHEAALARQTAEELAALPGVRVWGPAEGRLSLVSFSVEGVHPHDVAQVLDNRGVEIRAGHLCAQP
ncbi:MAG TPA: aminotransferase class V-fold PLP-dependent enzyme, partial [Kiritimatiellia bacterium]|nr:aminotransferase class V-fold PLP-dependent enzyme [Kiritimatiellia bacterium]